MAAAYLMSRAKAQDAASVQTQAVATREREPDAESVRERGSGRELARSRREARKAAPAWLGAVAMLMRGVQQGVRMVRSSASSAPPTVAGVRLRSPGALGDWSGRAAEAGAARLGTQWRRWRERRALAHAQRMVARDVEALRHAIRRR